MSGVAGRSGRKRKAKDGLTRIVYVRLDAPLVARLDYELVQINNRRSERLNRADLIRELIDVELTRRSFSVRKKAPSSAV